MQVLTILLACGEKDTDIGLDDTDPVEVVDDTGEVEQATSFNVNGLAIDFMTREWAPAGLCVDIVDPTGTLVSGDSADLEILGSAVVAEEGAFSVIGIETDSEVGLFVVLRDCADEALHMPTATGVEVGAYAEIEDGGTVAVQGLVFPLAMVDGAIDPSLSGLVEESVKVTGFMTGFVLAGGVPVDAAVVEGQDALVLYLDADPTDGLFTTAGELNVGTASAAGGAVMVPGAPITTYTCTHETETFGAQVFGAMPGLATVMAFDAE